MLTTVELAQAVLLPVLMAAALVGLARWRRLAWATPPAVVIGFLAGWVAFRGVPRLPPLDGTDWLFWIALGVGALGAFAAHGFRGHPRVGLAIVCLAAGLAFGTVASPLVPNVVPLWPLVGASLAVAAGAVLLAWATGVAAPRIGVAPLVAATAIAAGGAGIVILSSNLRVVGVYGLSASASLAGATVALFGMRHPSSVAIQVIVLTAAALTAGLLSGGHYYPDPGVPWMQAAALFAAPVLVLAGAYTPANRVWVRGVVAVVAVGVAVVATSVPTALRAMKSAQEDPYATYR